MTQPKPRPTWIGQSVGGRYKIEEQLGQGGMSAVYKATDPNLQRAVAVKLIHSHLSSDEEFVRRFEQEAAAVAQLRHPNIIQVYDFNHDEELYYMVLEFVPGETLQERLKGLNRAGRKLPLDKIINITATTCEAVGYAHENGMIHRDLKPANVMLNPKGQPILMDFGVAKMLGSAQHTATGAIIGTAKYMSPEQARGDRPDERTDIYSLGVMLFEMVTGEVPFNADSTIALLMKHVTDPIPDIREIAKDVPEPVVDVIKKALAKDRNDRFQTAAEMAVALRASLTTKGRTQSDDATILANATDITNIAPPLATGTVGQPTQPAKKGSVPVWAMGVGAVILVFTLGLGAFFMFSGSDDSPTEGDQNTGVAVVSTPGEPALPSADGMIRIPGNTYTVGTDVSGDNFAPIQQIDLKEFWIDQYEVSNVDYGRFVAETGQTPPPDWSGDTPPTDEENNPVDGIGWDSAGAYCTWANKRLPTEAEWEIAARGTEGRLFPWGNSQSVVPLPKSGTYPVGGKPTNQSPFGVFDMAGNVWEWVGDPYASIQAGNRLLRGGANGFLQNMVYRLQGDPNAPTMIASAGIRCATSKVILVEEVPLAEGVLASDDFADPGSGWPILAEGTFLYGYHPPSFFHVQVNTTDDHIVVSRDPELRDFTVETDVQVSSAETTEGDFRYGLVVRHSGDGQYYAFAISPRTGMWYILKGSPAGPEVLQEGTVETLRGLAPPGFSPDLDQIDTLRVDAQGENFIFHVNGKAVAQLTDADYENGELGFFDENVGETLSHIHYNTFTIREVEFDETTAASLAPTDTPVPPTPTEEAAPTEQASDSDALPTTEPEPTDEPSTPEPEAQATDTPVPTTAPDTKVIDDMVLIPAGYFLMGSQIGPPNERPEHPVLLNAFYLDPFETTNAQYRECIDGDGCTAPNGFPTSSSLANHPVVSVNWDQANAYCQWAGKRLPTESEWEYAASGPDNRIWPWGNTFDPNLSAASAAGTQPVGSYPEGASPFGVFDMAGNVNEWVADDFQQDSNFYATSPPMNPINDRGGAGRIFRGGSYDNPKEEFYTTSRRGGNIRTFSDVDVGFRCAVTDSNAVLDEALVTEFCELFIADKPGAPCP